MKIAAPAAILSILSLPALAQQVPGDVVSPAIAFFEAGIICAPDPVAIVPAPGTVAGVTNLIDGNPDFVSFGRAVPAVIGVGFGVRAGAALRDFPDVTIVVTHPPMGPEGATVQSYATSIGAATVAEDGSLSFYHLEYDYELVTGRWTFTAQVGEDMLYSAAFDVVPPDSVPELAGLCGYADLLS